MDLPSPCAPGEADPHLVGVRPSPGHLGVIAFLSTEWDARAIRAGLDFGLIDALLAAPATIGDIQQITSVSPRGLDFLIELLEANRVVDRFGENLRLTADFRSVFRFRDLLETRIAFADLVWPDFHSLFSALLTDVPQFMARSRTFDLFRYDRCLAPSSTNRAATEVWTRFTTCLTRYEAPAALEQLDLRGVANVIDLGGNTGEFALACCRRAPALRATVVDLPVVCDIGRAHIAASGGSAAARIRFWPCDMRVDTLPAPADLVVLKSVLHDWPDSDARSLISRARSLLRPGGRLMIFERAPIALSGRPAYGLAPDLVFLHFLRQAQFYLRVLEDVGLVDVEYRRVELEVGFHHIVARRPNGPAP